MGASIQGLDKFKLDVGGSNIKSKQTGTFSIDDGSLTKTVTITAINPNIAMLKVTFLNNTAYQPTNMYIKGVITNSTTLTFTLQNATWTEFVSWEVIEYNNVKSKQSGTYSGGGSIVALSPINSLKSICEVNFNCVGNATNDTLIRIILSNTTLSFSSGGAGSNNYYWQVIEFN